MRCTKALIFSDNLRHNINEMKKNLEPNVKFCCAVKANGYGNDAVNTAKIAEEMGASYLAIATVDEGIELRNNGIKIPLLLLSPCTPDEFSLLITYLITPLVFDIEIIHQLSKAVKKEGLIRKGIFLAIDTGMGRIGCLPDKAGEISKEIIKIKNIIIDGTITHFSVSDSITEENIEYTKNQYKKFLEAIKNIESNGISAGIKTCSASAACIAFPEFQMDMVRPGIILYGYYPDEITKDYLAKKGKEFILKPVMQLETKVAAIRRFKAGDTVSYGRTWTAEKETDIAVLPIGYADGLLRRNSPGLKVSINGCLYPIVGRICMDQCMVDIGLNNSAVKRWYTAIIFGPKENCGGRALLDATDIANLTQTITYEVMTSVSNRVKRVIINNKKR